MTDTPIDNTITYFIRNYGMSGNPDQRNIGDFMECETTEAVKSLQNELIGVSHGNFAADSMDRIVGLPRKQRFNSYEEWAKLMLMWIASYKG